MCVDHMFPGLVFTPRTPKRRAIDNDLPRLIEIHPKPIKRLTRETHFLWSANNRCRWPSVNRLQLKPTANSLHVRMIGYRDITNVAALEPRYNFWQCGC